MTRVGLEPQTSEYGVRGVNHKAIAPPIDMCAWLSNVTSHVELNPHKVTKCICMHEVSCGLDISLTAEGVHVVTSDAGYYHLQTTKAQIVRYNVCVGLLKLVIVAEQTGLC